jgi:hypothetical protein
MKYIIEPEKKISREEVRHNLEYTEEQLAKAEKLNLIKFDGNTMYELFFFQFLKLNAPILEKIKKGQI